MLLRVVVGVVDEWERLREVIVKRGLLSYLNLQAVNLAPGRVSVAMANIAGSKRGFEVGRYTCLSIRSKAG